MKSVSKAAAAAAIGLLTIWPAWGEEPSLDLVRMIACEVPAETYNAFALWLVGEPGAVESLGWTDVEQANPMLRQFRLPAPIEVFGHATQDVVFSATGPMALIAGGDPRVLAQSLGATAVVDTPDKFLAEKLVLEDTDEEDGITFATRVALNVSTVDTHPGAVLAGCSYLIEVR
ncbi:MAG: hypothetical protein AB7I79_04870 [Rhizobiaceae bacterium]